MASSLIPKFTRSGINRRTVLQAAAAAMSIPAVARATSAFAQEKLTGSGQVVVYSYGGSFTDGMRKRVFEPFTQATGITVVDVTADNAEPQVQAMHQAGRIDWDTAFIQTFNYPDMHKAGIFEPIDYSLWDAESLAGVPEKTRLQDAVAAFEAVMLLAFDERVFGDKGPKTWADFWNIEAFPGPRGLYSFVPQYTLQCALSADGVANQDIWPLTDDKVDRALKKLDEIKPYVTKWWTAGGESPQLLINGEYVMTSAFDGRAISSILNRAPIRIAWDGAYGNYNFWVVLKGGPNTDNAQKFIAFVNRAKNAAEFTLGTGYPGPNVNQLGHLPPELAALVNINPENGSKVVLEDYEWLAATRSDGKKNIDHLQERWLAWRAS